MVHECRTGSIHVHVACVTTGNQIMMPKLTSITTEAAASVVSAGHSKSMNSALVFKISFTLDLSSLFIIPFTT